MIVIILGIIIFQIIIFLIVGQTYTYVFSSKFNHCKIKKKKKKLVIHKNKHNIIDLNKTH